MSPKMSLWGKKCTSIPLTCKEHIILHFRDKNKKGRKDNHHMPQFLPIDFQTQIWNTTHLNGRIS